MNGRDETETVFQVADRLLGNLPVPLKYGVLIGDHAPEESVALELVETKGTHWFTRGWSLDAIGTRERAGLGVAKDVLDSNPFELDAGIYATQPYDDIFRGKFNPRLGIGIHLRF